MIQLVTPPIQYPVTLDEAKQHLRIIDDAEDAYIETLIGTGTDVAETITGRQLEPATYELTLDAFPAGPIDLPRPPLRSVERISYTDPNGVEQSFEDFELDTVRGRVLPDYGSHWPAARAAPNAVKVRFTCGYPTGETPFAIRSAILLLVGGLYENRESQTPHKLQENEAVGLLLWPYRVF
ncbi:MAG TPA: head-tail connector protein [Longimicrobiales bacterium]